jgi:hypothetical protein
MARMRTDNRHSQPPTFRARTASPGPNAWTGQSRDHEGQALLGSQASARQSPTARRSRAADRSGERHGRSIGMRIRPHRVPCGASLAGGSIVVRVKPQGNWRLSSDYRNDARSLAAVFRKRRPFESWSWTKSRAFDLASTWIGGCMPIRRPLATFTPTDGQTSSP